MDKDILRQYASISQEVEEEEKRIRTLEKDIEAMRPEEKEVSDIVTKGKHGKKTLGILKIHGNEDYKKINEKRAKLRERKAKKELHTIKLDSMIIQAEDYIYNIPESELRRIILYKLIDKKSWKEVAVSMGEGYTAEACKQKFSRFMRVK